ncbi:MAG: hypothetical protein COB67_11510 [SAR324 cluster bacterium]|uniref:HTH arsR-type domain-containing protein n=1 Tax=SAR324 cluster bacterium TaxID=2024889 RepID=A0A2A4STZ6_9DELT|nr:MAG: hypothetical protein COB67_11510 [SAR324 cluster bacterium]
MMEPQKKMRKVLNNPIKEKILWLLKDGKPRSLKELGRALSMSNATLQNHINKLKDIHLIKLMGRRKGAKGMMEKLYAVVEENILKHKSQENEIDVDFEVSYSVAWINERLREGVKVLKEDHYQHPFLNGSYTVNAPKDKVVEFKRQVETLFMGFLEEHKNNPSKDSTAISVVFSVLPSLGENGDENFNVIEYEPKED